MMRGSVNARGEATLVLLVGNGHSTQESVEVVIDTGFNGFLTLPPDLISRLALPWNASDRITLGDGSTALFDVYAATIRWDGNDLEIDVAESNTAPLMGMALLYGYRIQIEAIAGGTVIVQALSSLTQPAIPLI